MKRQPTNHRQRTVVIILALVSILVLLFALLLWMYPSSYDEQYIWMFFPAWAIWVVYAVTVLHTLIASVGILSAESTDQTWEPLVTTGIGVRQILLGKWLAAIHQIRSWLFLLAVVRIAVLPIYLLVSVKVAPSECGPGGGACVWQTSSLAWFGAVGMTVVLTIVDILCCAMIGLAVSAIIHHARFAALLAIFLRFLPLTVFMAFGFNDNNFWEWWTSPPFTLVDGGTAPAVQMVMPLIPRWVHLDPWLGLLMFASALIVVFLLATATAVVLLRRIHA